MAINDTSTFDPSRRIKAALGEDFANNLESEAIARLSAAMASNAIRKPIDTYSEEDEKDMFIDKIASKIKHTNPINKNEEQEKDPIGLEGKNESDKIQIRYNSYKKSCEAFDSIINNNSKMNNVIKAFTGIKKGSPHIKTDIIHCTAQNIGKYVINNCMESALSYGDIKGIAVCSSVSISANIISQYLFSSNNVYTNELFDENIITSAEANIIKATINKEKMKYTLQHTAATIVVPAVIKLGINHFCGKYIENNKILKFATSFGVLSEVGNVCLKTARNISEKKHMKAVKEELLQQYNSIDNNGPIIGYSTLAKASINHELNSSIFNGSISGAIGSVVGHNSMRDFMDEINEQQVISKSENIPKVTSPTPKKTKVDVINNETSDKKIA